MNGDPGRGQLVTTRILTSSTGGIALTLFSLPDRTQPAGA